MNFIIKWIKKRRAAKTVDKKEIEPVRKENVYLPYIRGILEQVLEQKELDYRRMHLLVIDTDMEPESLLDEDDVWMALEQLSPDLNFLVILTDRPAYFQEYVETMYEETGLLVGIEAKDERRKFQINTVLDFEQKGRFWNLELPEVSIYLPIYKKSWETVGNLDIFVPIGYNTVIVKGFRAIEKRGRVS